MGAKCHQIRKSFGKGTTSRRGLITEKSPDAQMQLDMLAANSENRGTADVPTMHPNGLCMTIWTRDSRTYGRGSNDELAVTPMNRIYGEFRQGKR